MSSTQVIFLSTLREGADAEEYERWIREVDYPTARSLPSVVSYNVLRISGAIRGSAPCHYVELIEVSDFERYRMELQTMPGRTEFLEELNSFLGDVNSFYGTLVE
ncbi:hypothetical protein JNB63_10570 [Microbacterium trichothecenolyticum]|uniref:REDY-like protein HapK n=1 Tax=Microbacterium ureisolvens TaxID=2781186 RepID=A0ABS7I0R4_9MICO|nr:MULTISPECIES: hypothetical protein [Microbacterium]MBW9110435.1 hypothetical protein [Microbacterium ureisolvens]MBW9120540.1 hypothetical protein [Microbacterium trichothecenolyticum]